MAKEYGVPGGYFTETGTRDEGFPGGYLNESTSVINGFGGTTSAATALTGAIIRDFRALAGTSSKVTALTGLLGVLGAWAGSTTATTSLTGDIVRDFRALRGTTSETTHLTGSIVASPGLEGSVTATTHLTGNFVRNKRALAGTTDETTALVGALSIFGDTLIGNTNLTTSLTGNFVRNKRALVGVMHETTALVGRLTKFVPISGSTTIITHMVGHLIVTKPAQFVFWWRHHNPQGHFPSGRTSAITGFTPHLTIRRAFRATTPNPLNAVTALTGDLTFASSNFVGDTDTTTALDASLSMTLALQGATAAVTGLNAIGLSGNTKSLAGSASTTTAIANAALKRTLAFAGSTSITGALTGTIVANHKFVGAMNCATALTGAIQRTRRISGLTASLTNLSGTGITAQARNLIGATAMTSSLSARLGRIRKAAGSTIATTALTGALIRNRRGVTGNAALTTSLTGTTFVRNKRGLTGSTVATTALSANLGKRFLISGTTTETTSLTGSIASSSKFLFGSTSATTALAGAIVRTRGVVGATSTTTALLNLINIKLNHRLVGNAQSITALTGLLGRQERFRGSLSLITTLSGSIVGSQKFISGTTAITTSLTAAIKRTRKLIGITNETTSLTGAIIRARKLTGAATATTSLAATLGKRFLLLGTTVATTSLTGSIADQSKFIIGSTSATTALANAALKRTRKVIGSAIETTSLTGNLIRNRHLSGNAVLATTLSASLNRSRKVIAAMAMITAAAGSMRRTRRVIGAANATTALSAALTKTSGVVNPNILPSANLAAAPYQSLNGGTMVATGTNDSAGWPQYKETFTANRSGLLLDLSGIIVTGQPYCLSILVAAGQTAQWQLNVWDGNAGNLSSALVTGAGRLVFPFTAPTPNPAVSVSVVNNPNAAGTVTVSEYKLEIGSSFTGYVPPSIPLPIANPGSTTATTAVLDTFAPNVTNTYTSLSISTPAAHGTAGKSGTNLTYLSNAGYTGSDSFAYTATNSAGTSAPATISVTVIAANARNYMIGLYRSGGAVDPVPISSWWGYKPEFTINNSFQDHVLGGGFSSGNVNGYPIVIDIDIYNAGHTFNNYALLANGTSIDAQFNSTINSAIGVFGASTIYAVRIDSEWNLQDGAGIFGAVSATTYKAAFNKVVALCKAAGLSNAKYIFNPNIFHDNSGGISNYVPSGADLIGIDVYSNPAFPFGANSTTTAQAYFTNSASTGSVAWWAGIAAGLGKPLCFPECGDDWGDGVFINFLKAFVDTPANNVVMLTYWDSSDGEAAQLRDQSGGGTLNNGGSLAAFQTAFANRTYGGTYWLPLKATTTFNNF